MTLPVVIDVEVPEALDEFRFPPRLDQRLQLLLDKQDREGALTPEERGEAEYLNSPARDLTHVPRLPSAVCSVSLLLPDYLVGRPFSPSRSSVSLNGARM